MKQKYLTNLTCKGQPKLALLVAFRIYVGEPHTTGEHAILGRLDGMRGCC
jgi:hypothetical protein